MSAFAPTAGELRIAIKTRRATSDIAQCSKQHVFDHLVCAGSSVSGTAMSSALALFMLTTSTE